MAQWFFMITNFVVKEWTNNIIKEVTAYITNQSMKPQQCENLKKLKDFSILNVSKIYHDISIYQCIVPLTYEINQ